MTVALRHRRRLHRAQDRLTAKLESLSMGCLMLYATGHSTEAEKLVPKMERVTHSINLIHARLNARKEKP